MSEPILKVQMESGQSWDDPSGRLLFDLLSDVERGAEEFMIVERRSDPTGHTYVQVCRIDEDCYQVEHRDGGPDHHFQAVTPDKRVAHFVITAWALDLPGWREVLAWEPLDLSG
jgi:hypothetical protein